MSIENKMFAKPGDKHQLETGLMFSPKFDAAGLIPVITQDATSGEILMFAFMNELALEKTLTTKTVHYWSRSRNKLWLKGETSGETQAVVEIKTDCDQDVILIRANVGGRGAACHTGRKTCFYRSIDLEAAAKGKATALNLTGGTPLFDPKEVYK